MTEHKWTPGEWLIEDGSKSCHCCFSESIYVQTGPESYDFEVIAETLSSNEGDAHLLRSAKDLYEALDEARDILEAMNISTEKEDVALAKARGEA